MKNSEKMLLTGIIWAGSAFLAGIFGFCGVLSSGGAAGIFIVDIIATAVIWEK